MRYPDHTFEDAARAAGANVQCLWEMKGPRNTAVAWLTCLSVNGAVAIVQTYREDGWEVYTAGQSNRVDDTIADALNRCRVSAPAA